MKKQKPVNNLDQKMKAYHEKIHISLILAEAVKSAAKSIQALSVAINGWKR